MKDYAFANRLTELRRAKGYSQYQLATMMGVSSKAVSKWETGNSRPRTSACSKLAYLLGVDIDLLMDSDTLTQDETDALPEKQRRLLWQKAENRMYELYGEEPPLRIMNHFIRERNALHRTDAIIMFDILSQVIQAAGQKRVRFNAPGAECFASWLLGATEVNPLEPHLRCPKCHRVEFHPEAQSGWDLPEKTCECGERMIPDGQDIPIDLCVFDGGNPYEFFRCEIDADFMPEAEKIILSYGEQFFSMERFHEDGSEDVMRSPEGIPVTDPETGKQIPVRYLPMTSLMFRPKRKAKVRKPDKITGPAELMNWGRRSGQPTIVLQGDFFELPYLSGRSPFRSTPDELIRPEVMKKALQEYWPYMQSKTEMRSGMKLPDPERYMEGMTFGRFVSLLCSVNNIYMTSGPEELAEKTGFADMLDMPVSMEDLWKMIARCSAYPGYMSGTAGVILWNTGSGKYLVNAFREGIGPRERRLFREMNLPEWFETYASNIMDLCFRSVYTEEAIHILEDARRKIRDEKKR